MNNTETLYQNVLRLLDQGQWRDLGHLKTAANMIAGLILSASSNLTAWIPYTLGRALQAQSVQRRFARWLNNPRVGACELYAPLIQAALADWGKQPLYLALDTTMLWGRYCMIRLSVVYRGRAVPLDWQVVEHASARVAFSVYRQVLERGAQRLPDTPGKIVLLGDRGFADLALMRLCRRLGWHYRLRIKGKFIVYRGRHNCCTALGLLPRQAGQAVFWHNVYLTGKRYGPVHLALARPTGDEEPWLIVSDELTSMHSFKEYGLRFDIEENFLDDKSNGFQLEGSQLRSAAAIERLFFGIAVATLYLVVQGTEVVDQGQRRTVDPHWFRGSSYLKIGWYWVKHALTKGWQLIRQWSLSGRADPEPAKASRAQYEQAQQRFQAYKCNTFIYGT